jgi:L-lactate utilization protein LutB
MFDQLANKETVEKTKLALEGNGFTVILAENGQEAKQKALELIPRGAEIMTMTSVTTETIGLTQELNDSGNYSPLRNKLYSKDTPDREKKRLGAAPEYVSGSVHAITEDGKVIVVSNTGSQLPAYAYGADKVIWVAGTQKIVKDLETGMKRIHEYIFPLETPRARNAYGLPETFNTFDSKQLIFQRELIPGRIIIILVNEVLGF